MLHQAAHKHGSALDGFQQHIAGEAVADYHIHCPQGYIPGLYITNKVDKSPVSSILQQSISLFLQGCTLGILCTDIQQAHLGVRHPQGLLGVQRAHQTELEQKLRCALSISAAIQDHRLATGLIGHSRAHRCPADSFDPFHKQRCAGKQRAGTAGGHKGIAPSVSEHLQADDHRRILPFMDHCRRIIVHIHHVLGIDDLHSGRQVCDSVATQDT